MIEEIMIDPNTKDVIGNPLLSIATKTNNINMVNYLLETNGTDVNSKDADKKTPLQVLFILKKKCINR